MRLESWFTVALFLGDTVGVPATDRGPAERHSQIRDKRGSFSNVTTLLPRRGSCEPIV